jgi:hypothetical protein
MDLQELLGHKVALVTERGLRERIREHVLRNEYQPTAPFLPPPKNRGRVYSHAYHIVHLTHYNESQHRRFPFSIRIDPSIDDSS